jgi:uncharacterized protein
MKVKKIPLRRCLASNEQYPKKEMIRIVRTPDGEVVVDTTGKANGRGAYLKLSLENIELLKKKNQLSRVLECEVPDGIYDQLKAILNGK